MIWANSIYNVVIVIQHVISAIGIFIIVSGVILAAVQYFYYLLTGQLIAQAANTNIIRLKLGRILILGLEFIVASDLISTTTSPDYYSIGIVAIVVAIRTLLSFSLNKEIMSLSKEEQPS